MGVHSALAVGVGTGRKGAMAVPVDMSVSELLSARRMEEYLCLGTESISPWRVYEGAWLPVHEVWEVYAQHWCGMKCECASAGPSS
jgi:hypothetical protein